MVEDGLFQFSPLGTGKGDGGGGEAEVTEYANARRTGAFDGRRLDDQRRVARLGVLDFRMGVGRGGAAAEQVAHEQGEGNEQQPESVGPMESHLATSGLSPVIGERRAKEEASVARRRHASPGAANHPNSSVVNR